MYLALSSSVRRSAYERFYYAHHVRNRCRLSTVSAALFHLGSGLGACRQVFLLLVLPSTAVLFRETRASGLSNRSTDGI